MMQAKHWNEKRYYSLDYYLKHTFGEKVYRISLNGGMTCPNRDGTNGDRGCIFCSQGGSGDFAGQAACSISEQIAQGKQLLSKKTSCKKFIAYFQAYTNTYAPVSYLRKIFTEAITQPEIAALSIATRPDCLSPEILSLLDELSQRKPVWIELGLQTIHPASSAFIRSGFSLTCFQQAVMDLQAHHIPVIVHLILGLPHETREQMLASVDYVAHLPVSGIKLQLLHVLRETDLADYYESHPFPIFSREDYCRIIADCIERLPETMVIHRLTGDGPRDLLIAPLWSTDKKNVLNQIHRELKIRDTWQGKYFHHEVKE